MYRIRHQQYWEYEANTRRGLSRFALIARGRGFPVVFTLGRTDKTASVVVYDAPNLRYNEKQMTPSDQISLLDALASTSAYLGPLADRRMYKVVNRQSMGLFRLFLRWGRLNGLRLYGLAPSIRLNPQMVVRTSDGCLWDNRGLGSLLYGLQRDRLMAERPVLFVVTSDARHKKRWWHEWWERGTKRRHEFTIESTFFDGHPSNHLVAKYTGPLGSYGMHYAACVVSTKLYPLGWIQGGLVDLIVIGINGTKLNSIPFNKKRNWHMFHANVKRTIAQIWEKLNCQAVSAKRVVGVAISGGGARTGISGFEFLHFLEKRRVYPAVLSGNSGGAWSIALNALHSHKIDIVDVLFANVHHMFRMQLVQHLLLTAIRYVQGTIETGETLAYLLPLLRNFRFDWRSVVEHIVFDSTARSWNIFARKKCRIVIPATILGNSET